MTTLFPEKQRISQQGRTIKKAFLKEATPTFTYFFSKRLSLFLFSSDSISKKWLFDKVFNLDSWPLANDHAKQNVNLSFAKCLYLLVIKINRLQQKELLNQMPSIQQRQFYWLRPSFEIPILFSAYNIYLILQKNQNLR